MQEPGRKLRRIRERLSLKYRDVENASNKIALHRGNPEFAIGLSRLADIENKGTTPSVYRIYSLCAIYGISFSLVLSWYGVEVDALPADAAKISLNHTRPIDFDTVPPGVRVTEMAADIDNDVDLKRTTCLSRQSQRWGKLPLGLTASLERRYRYAVIGQEDWSMYPLLPPGSFVQIDETKRHIATAGWQHEYERPIYFIEHRAGYRCGWCTEIGGFLLVQTHAASHVPPEIFRYPGEADVIGQVVGVTMRLDLGKRRHTRS
ncbi:MAG: helix-turn-helix transcriptional regulator [Acidobacteriaceae bacterium]|nr:helix-turn-helix transcriptional regulator [Acidobacteriaceae bacterium]